MDEIKRFEMHAEFDKQVDDKSVHALEPDGLDEDGRYKLRFSNEYGLWLESALQSAREEIETSQHAHEEIADICFKAGVKTDDGTSVSAVKNLATESETLKAEADRMRAAIKEARKCLIIDLNNPDQTSVEILANFDNILTPPAAPEKAETCPTCQGVLARGGIDPLTGKKCPTCKGTGKPIAESGE